MKAMDDAALVEVGLGGRPAAWRQAMEHKLPSLLEAARATLATREEEPGAKRARLEEETLVSELKVRLCG